MTNGASKRRSPGRDHVLTFGQTGGGDVDGGDVDGGDVDGEDVDGEDVGGKTKDTARARHGTDADRQTHEKMGFHQGRGLRADQLAALVATL